MDRSLKKKGVELIAKVGLLLIVSLFMLGACELTVRAFVPVRNVGPSFTMHSPVYGKRIRPSISVTRITPEFVMRLSTNAQGFRQPDEVPLNSHPILFLGDSFTMGYGVDDGSEFVALIRKRRPDDGPFLNAGMGDNGNGRWLKFLTREAPRFAPRLIVLQVMKNDFNDNRAERLFVLQEGELVEQPVAPPGPRDRVQSTINALPALANLYLVGLLRQVRLPSGTGRTDTGGNETDDPDELTFRLIDRAVELCEEQGWPVLGLSVGLEGAQLERLKQLFDDHQAPLLVAPNQETHPELYYETDGHWNAQGHAYAADLVADAIDAIDQQ